MEIKAGKREKWIIWSMNWASFSTFRFATYYAESEAKKAISGLNESPSARWYLYSLQYVPRAKRG